MKKNNRIDVYWKGVPQGLRYMCLATQFNGGDPYCTQAVIHYLIDHMEDCDRFLNGTTPYDIILQIDRALETCLFPICIHESDWVEYTDDIEKILCLSEDLVRKIGPRDYKEGYLIPHSRNKTMKIIELSQKLDVYFSVLYMFKRDYEKLKEKLDLVLGDTERNIVSMLSYEDAEDYAYEDDWMNDHYPGYDVWEPINWLIHESISDDNARMMLARAYEGYAVFLDGEKVKPLDKCARLHIRKKVEKRLQDLCDLIVDGIEDTFQTKTALPEGVFRRLTEEKTEFDGMIERSFQRELELTGGGYDPVDEILF